MRIGDPLPDKQAPTRIAVRLAPSFGHGERRIGDPESRVRGDGDGELVVLQMALGEFTTEPHVLFHRDEITQGARVRSTGGGFEHVSTVLGVKGRHDHADECPYAQSARCLLSDELGLARIDPPLLWFLVFQIDDHVLELFQDFGLTQGEQGPFRPVFRKGDDHVFDLSARQFG